MAKNNVFFSERAQKNWERRGSPYCEHPRFSKDGNDWGTDEVDYYCDTCGAIRVGRDGEPPPPSGVV